MRFLVTDSINGSSGSVRIIRYTLIFFLLFFVAHGIREFYNTGFLPGEIKHNLYGKPTAETTGLVIAGQKSPTIILEDLHIDLFLYSMVFLFLGSLLYRTKFSWRVKRFWLSFLFFIAFFYALAKPTTFYFSFFAHAVFVFGLLFHLGFIFFILLLWRETCSGNKAN